MNLELITALALTLCAPVETVTAVNVVTNTSSSQSGLVSLEDSVGEQKKNVSFTIDRSEVAGATTIWADLLGERTALQGRGSGLYALPYPLSAENPVVVVTVSKSGGGMLGEDVLIWGKKEALVFNADNNARATVISGLISFGTPNGQLVQAYEKISDRPKLPELRRLLVKEKGWPDDEMLLDLIVEATFEIAADILEELNRSL